MRACRMKAPPRAATTRRAGRFSDHNSDLIVLATVSALAPLALAALSLHFLTPHATQAPNLVLGGIVFTAALRLFSAPLSMGKKRI